MYAWKISWRIKMWEVNNMRCFPSTVVGCKESHHGYKSNLFSTRTRAEETQVVWSQYTFARYKCVRSDSTSQNNEKVELHRYISGKIGFCSLSYSHRAPFIAVTHISHECSREERAGWGGKGKFMCAINVLIWATRRCFSLARSFYFAPYMLQFSFEVKCW